MSQTTTDNAAGRLGWTRGEIAGVVLAVVLAVGFGVLTLRRTAWRWEPMTDAVVYFRAAEAVRLGESPYQIEFRKWHYVYPPLLAILMRPLAEPPLPVPPAGQDGFRGISGENLRLTGSISVWYALNVVFVVLAISWLARTMEDFTDARSAEAAIERRRFWQWRLVPAVVCLSGILITLNRGQVELLLLLCFAGAISNFVRKRNFRAGLWMALPICIKIIPAALLLYPLWRRNWKCLAGCAVGLLVGLVLIPAAVLGPAKAWAFNKEYAEVLLLPGLGKGEDRSRAAELINMNATDNQSLLNVVFNRRHPEARLASQSQQADAASRMIAQGIGVGMVLMILLAAGWRKEDSPAGVALFLGTLIVAVVLSSPVCHKHYFVQTIPLIMGIMVLSEFGKRTSRFGIVCAVVFGVMTVCVLSSSVPGIQKWVNFNGVPTMGVMGVWGVGVYCLWRRGVHHGEGIEPQRHGGTEKS